MSTGFIIQARLGSTRLPQKVVKPFYDSKNILDIIISKLKNKYPDFKIVIATTTNTLDDEIEKIALSYGIPCYRGSESNVLKRFIEAADNYNMDVVFRVCADNPFIDEDCFPILLAKYEKGQADYVGFSVQGIPSIKTHFGFWGELVSVSALKKVASLTEDPFFQEHVTNYIYGHPDQFKLEWIELDPSIAVRNDIRLTVDTQDDFNALSRLYAVLSEENMPLTPAHIIEYLDKHPVWKEKMANEIQRNSK